MGKAAALIRPLLMLVAGSAVGGGSAFAARHFLDDGKAAPAKSCAPAVSEEAQFIDIKDLSVPLVFADGTLAGYSIVSLKLEVAADNVEAAESRLPLMIDAINRRSFAAQLVTGPDGQLPNLDALRRLVNAAAREAYPDRAIRRVAIIKAAPA